MTNIKDIIEPHRDNNMEWMKSAEVKTYLKVSSGSLPSLRIHEKLNPVKIGGVYYYKKAEVVALFEQRK